MQRRIQFRGYNLKNKKWLYGYYLVNRGKHYIVQDEVVNPFAEESDFEVDPESVGQFVATSDGVDLYEGDYINKVELNYYEERLYSTFSLKCMLKYCSKTHQVMLVCVDDMYSSKDNIGYIITKSEGNIYKLKRKYEVTGNEYEENIKSFQSIESIEKKVLDDWRKLDEEIFLKQHELIMENRKR